MHSRRLSVDFFSGQIFRICGYFARSVVCATINIQLFRSSSLKLFTSPSPGTTFRRAVFDTWPGHFDVNRKFIVLVFNIAATDPASVPCWLSFSWPALRPLRKSNPPLLQGTIVGKDQNSISMIDDATRQQSAKVIHSRCLTRRFELSVECAQVINPSQSMCTIKRGRVACDKSEKQILGAQSWMMTRSFAARGILPFVCSADDFNESLQEYFEQVRHVWRFPKVLS